MTTTSSTTLQNIGVTMFTVSDVDAALAWYTEKLGFEVRADLTFGESGENRWLEVAPPGSVARLSLNPPMGSTPGGGSIGVETPDVMGEYARLRETDGVQIANEPMDMAGAPKMFSVTDPDGNYLWIVETPPAS
jgi:catechol 2,3-dioxygenase-like lactoylglutathione lyase family enzyme